MLLKCHECGRDVSSDAWECPHCKANMSKHPHNVAIAEAKDLKFRREHAEKEKDFIAYKSRYEDKARKRLFAFVAFLIIEIIVLISSVANSSGVLVVVSLVLIVITCKAYNIIDEDYKIEYDNKRREVYGLEKDYY